MKTLWNISIVLALMLFVSCKSIDDIHKNEYSVSVGIGSDDCELGETSMSTNTNRTNDVHISASYEHYVTKCLYLGVSASFFPRSYEVWDGEDYGYCGFDLHRQIANNSVYTLSILPTVKFNWFRKKYCTMYSRMSVGFAYRHERITQLENANSYLWDKTLDKVSLRCQLSPWGIEGGTKHIRLFTEMGFGLVCLQAGIRIRY